MDESGDSFIPHFESHKIPEDNAPSQSQEPVLRTEKTLPEDYKQFIANLRTDSLSIGEGADKVVYDHPTDPTKVVAVFKYDDKDINAIKRRFYVNKVLHMLYPDNIPDISLASSNPMSLILEKASGEQLDPSKPNFDKKSQYFAAVQALSDELESLGINIDSNYVNFHIATNGMVQYVDDFSGRFNVTNNDLVHAIRSQLPPDDQERALRYLTKVSTEFKKQL